MLDDGYDARSDAVLETATDLAFSSGTCEPLHLLVALSEDDGPSAHLLRAASVPGGLRASVFGELGPAGQSVFFDFRTRQVMGSAHQWASAQNALVTPEHLLAALIEQSDPDVVAACATAGVDLGAARQRALAELGWSDASVPPLEPLEPAGTMDRPPLPLNELPSSAWVELEDRQQRLPFSRVRRTWQWYALSHNEARIARRIVDRGAFTADECSSLLHHHRAAINRLAADAIPMLVPQRHAASSGLFAMDSRAFRRRQLVPRGWICWLGNRRAGIRDAWFRLTWRY